MRKISIRRWSSSMVVLAFALLFGSTVKAQTKPLEQNDVIRVDTTLVQTDVMVFDKKGHFVDGLRQDQFELKVDNKSQPIAFFDRVTSARSEQKIAQEKSPAGSNSATDSTKAAGTRGRVLIFFVDDLHLSPGSLVRTRKALTEFIDHGMANKDVAAITSSSGQIGFLQQFTDDKGALHAAVARLNYRTNTKVDTERPPMSEYIALKIREGDEQALTYYVQEIQKQNCFKVNGEVICSVTPQSARLLAKERA